MISDLYQVPYNMFTRVNQEQIWDSEVNWGQKQAVWELSLNAGGGLGRQP